VRVASGEVRAKVAKGRPPLHAEGAESAPQDELAPVREALIDEAIALFGPRYARTLDREEARQMIERLTKFFELLAERRHRAQKDGPDEGEVAA
jgi:hypothetical protein